jgi:hypothetical protein
MHSSDIRTVVSILIVIPAADRTSNTGTKLRYLPVYFTDVACCFLDPIVQYCTRMHCKPREVLGITSDEEHQNSTTRTITVILIFLTLPHATHTYSHTSFVASLPHERYFFF